MSVQSLTQVLNDFACEYLEGLVPEEVECVVDVATVLVPEVDEDGDITTMSPVVRVGLWSRYPEGPGGEATAPSATSGTLPYLSVQDGDTEPLAMILDGLWEGTVFLHAVYPALGEMSNALKEKEGEACDHEDDQES